MKHYISATTTLLMLVVLTARSSCVAGDTVVARHVTIVETDLSPFELHEQHDYMVLQCADDIHDPSFVGKCHNYLVRLPTDSHPSVVITKRGLSHRPDHHRSFREKHLQLHHHFDSGAAAQHKREEARKTTNQMMVRLWSPLDEKTQHKWAHDHELRVVRRLDSDPAVVVSPMSGDAAALREEVMWHYLAQDDNVRSAEPLYHPFPLDAYSNYVTQSNQKTECDSFVVSYGCTPLWDAGLDGGDQLLGSGDTGVNMRQCYFDDTLCGPSDDSNHPPTCGGSYVDEPCSDCVGYCDASSSPLCVPTDQGQRKMRAFKATINDYTDTASMHGTATMSVAVGSTQLGGPLATENDRGAAPAARLAFQDIGDGGGGLSIPLPLDTEFLPFFTANNAHVNSESWGSFSSSGYNSLSQQLDSYTFYTQTELAVFAAGNSGDPNDFGVFLLIGPEASAKNVLTVGATINELEAILQYPSFSSQYGLSVSSNATLWSSRSLAGWSSNGPTLDRRIKPDVCVPGLLITAGWEDAARTNTATANCNFPDSVAGWSGTSFAAPQAAGLVLLMRQWLQDGFYGNGLTFAHPSAALLKNLIIASAQDIARINYYIQNKVVEKAAIDARPELAPFGSLWAWGHGIPLMAPYVADGTLTRNVLLVDTFSGATMVAQNTNLLAIDNTDDERALCLRSTLPSMSQSTLSASLVWSDFPGSLPLNSHDARITRLVNDLDLFTVDQVCNVGFPNTLGGPDHYNNVEVVQVGEDNSLAFSSDIYHLVVVRSSRIIVAGQHWSLVLLNDHGTVHLSGEVITLTRNSTSTDFPLNHPCSMIYSGCSSQINAARQVANSLPPQPTTTTTSSSTSGSGSIATAMRIPLVTMLALVLLVFSSISSG